MRWAMAAMALALALAGGPAVGQQVANGLVTIQAVREGGVWTGFDLYGPRGRVIVVRLSSGGLIAAGACSARGRSLSFRDLRSRAGSGLRLGAADRFTVTVGPGDPSPQVSFDLTIAAFDARRWQATVGQEPFHFLAIYEPEAEAWHQRGWLNATPYADPFPLLQDVHVGTPEISAYHYNRRWSATAPLGANPLPVIGLWAPSARRYVGLEFLTTRLGDNSERDIATGYRWCGSEAGWAAAGGARRSPGPAHAQFVALVYPHGGAGYQSLALPERGARIASHAGLIWSDGLGPEDDPNRLIYSRVWPRIARSLPRVPAVADLSWLPGGIRLPDFGGPAGPGLIAGPEGSFQVEGSRKISGWGWHNEGPTAFMKRTPDPGRLVALEREAADLLRSARRFTVGGDLCVYWDKPLEGSWSPAWGGAPVTSLHNANGFAAGRLFLGLYRDLGRADCLPIVDGVFNWARHVAWTRNEFDDVPSSPFAIGGTLSAAFCLDYFMTFRDSGDPKRRADARRALDLARSFTYRYLTLWPSDNSRMDNLDPSFLWEPNSGRDWTGAACANEVFWNLDTLAQTAVQTGDPVLMWALQGSLDRWNLLYQDAYRADLSAYQPGDMTEGYGLYAGNVYGVGKRAPYGFASPLYMTEPVGSSTVRVLAGERAAMAFNKRGAHTVIRDYRCSGPGRLAFTLAGSRAPFDLSLTVPYVDISDLPVTLVRGGRAILLEPGVGYRRPPQALWSLLIFALRPGDRVRLGRPDERGPVLPCAPPLVRGEAAGATSAATPIAIPFDTRPEAGWSALAGWPGLPRGLMWSYGIPFRLASAHTPCALAHPAPLRRPIHGARQVALLFSDGDGPPPAVRLADGALIAADQLPSLAWRAWPPIFTRRLVAALAPVGGRTVVGLAPNGRTIWAASAIHGTPGARAIVSALGVAAGALARLKVEDHAVERVAREMERLAPGAIAVLPPSPASPAVSLAVRAGLGAHSVALTPAQLVDPACFNAQRFPVALYAGGETYIHTVRERGDGAQALARFVEEGGTLLLLSMGPFPLFYGDRPGGQLPDPLTERLGVPMTVAIERAPAARLMIDSVPGQTFAPGLPATFDYPEGDVRLRSIDPVRLAPGAVCTSLFRVRDSAGGRYGDAAAIVAPGPGKGRILYVWGGLMRHDRVGAAISEAAVRWMIEAARR